MQESLWKRYRPLFSNPRNCLFEIPGQIQICVDPRKQCIVVARARSEGFDRDSDSHNRYDVISEDRSLRDLGFIIEYIESKNINEVIFVLNEIYQINIKLDFENARLDDCTIAQIKLKAKEEEDAKATRCSRLGGELILAGPIAGITYLGWTTFLKLWSDPFAIFSNPIGGFLGCIFGIVGTPSSVILVMFFLCDLVGSCFCNDARTQLSEEKERQQAMDILRRYYDNLENLDDSESNQVLPESAAREPEKQEIPRCDSLKRLGDSESDKASQEPVIETPEAMRCMPNI